MAGRNLRDLWDELQRRLRQQQAKKPDDGPSYFADKADKDTKPDRGRPGRPSQTDTARAGPRPGDPRRPAEIGDVKKGFDDATDAKRVIEQQKFERRFRTEETRRAAIEAREDIQRERDEVEEKHQAELRDAMAVIQRLVDDRRPAPPDAARDANRKVLDVYARRERAMARLDEALAGAYGQLDVMEAKLINWGPNRRLLTTSYQTDPDRDFNAAALPPGMIAEADFTDADFEEASDEDTVIYVRPEPDDAVPEPAEPAPALPRDWVAEFNRNAKPRDDGPGIRP